MSKPDTTKLKNLLQSARNVTLFLPQNPHYDAVATSLALKLSLDSTGKRVTVLCPDPITVEFNRLVGVDSIASNFGSRHLIISFPGQTENVDKISYNVEQGELQLVVTPKTEAPDLDHTKLRFITNTNKADLAILVGVHQLLDLGNFFHTTKDFFTNTQLVSLTVDLPQENYTPNQIYDPNASSLSEITLQLIEALELKLDADIASNLLAGLEFATDNFRSRDVSHNTFDVAAKLMRRGARRHDVFKPENLPEGAIPQAPPPASPKDNPPAKTPEPSPDWYEPKIFSGTSTS